MNFEFSNNQTGIIIGGSSGIAQAVGQHLNQKFPELKILSISRDREKPVEFSAEKYYFDYLSESGWRTFETLIGGKKIDFILNFVGALNGNENLPEKNLRALEFENLTKCIEINLKPIMLATQILQRNIKRDQITLVSSLSAKVGSIEGNDLGGWYSYRIAKAGLNMFLKTLSREFYFKYPKCIVNAIHPGTTRTSFTAAYLSSVKHKVHEPEGTAENLIKVWEGLTHECSGEFRNWDGSVIPW